MPRRRGDGLRRPGDRAAHRAALRSFLIESKTMNTTHMPQASIHQPVPQQPAPTAPGPAVPRLDLYAGIHKAMRMAMSETLVRLGSTDAADSAQVRDTLGQVRALLDACIRHLEHENAFMHPALERARPGASAQIAAEHGQHADAVEELAELVQLAETSDGQARALALHRLYRALALFVAENFEHMHYEETEHNAVLWAHYTDAELMALHDTLVASIPPAEMMGTLGWLVPAMSAHERLEMFAGMRATAPAPAFEAALGVARSRLAPGEWVKLARGLGVPAAPQMWPEFVQDR